MQGVLLRVFLLGGSVLAAVILGAPSRVKRTGENYESIPGEGDLKHRNGLFVGTANGFVVLKQDSSPDTKWKFTDNGWMHLADGKCVHPEGGYANPRDGNELVLSSCEPHNPERIKFLGVKDGDYWIITQKTSGKCIHPNTGWANVGFKLVLHSACDRDDRLDYILENVPEQTDDEDSC